MTPKGLAELWYYSQVKDGDDMMQVDLMVNALAQMIDQHFVARSRLVYVNQHETLTQSAYYLEDCDGNLERDLTDQA